MATPYFQETGEAIMLTAPFLVLEDLWEEVELAEAATEEAATAPLVTKALLVPMEEETREDMEDREEETREEEDIVLYNICIGCCCVLSSCGIVNVLQFGFLFINMACLYINF